MDLLIRTLSPSLLLLVRPVGLGQPCGAAESITGHELAGALADTPVPQRARADAHAAEA